MNIFYGAGGCTSIKLLLRRTLVRLKLYSSVYKFTISTVVLQLVNNGTGEQLNWTHQN